MNRILVIQTAFIGDVILATGIIEKLHTTYPEADIQVVVRKGNESLFQGHPFVEKVFVWHKKEGKYRSLIRLARQLRGEQYDAVINVQRFASSGFLTWRTRAKWKAGFSKNPFSFCYKHRITHIVGDGKHEIERNQQLIAPIAPGPAEKPRLYPTQADLQSVSAFKILPYVTMSPASVWFTKQWPEQKWVELINLIPNYAPVFLLGGPNDESLCKRIASATKHPAVHVAAGKLSLLQTAALMKDAVMNYTNDSAPLHLASAMNAAVTAMFCSTIPAFGFGPLSENSMIVETQQKLDCRPCGLHGKKACPQGHFICGNHISMDQFQIPL